MEDFSFKTRISKNQFLLLSLVITYSHNFVRALTIIGLIIIGYSIFQLCTFGQVTSLLFSGIFCLFFMPIIILFKANSLYDKSGELSQDFVCEFNNSHFKVIGQNSIDSITWNKVVRVINLRKYLVIFTGRHSGKMINAKHLTNAQKQFIIRKGI